jgi:hypothetical protein
VLLADKNDKVMCFVNKDYEFQIPKYPAYHTDKGVKYDRRLTIPDELVKGYKVDADMGIEIILREFVVDEEYIRKLSSSADFKIEVKWDEIRKPVEIFSEQDVVGIMDFKPKGIKRRLFDTAESLIATKFSDKFYDKLVFEINNAFRFGLLTATIVMLRKLFERLIIDLLRTKYGIGQKELWYSEDDGGFHSLSKLIHNLRPKLEDFKPYDFFKLNREKENFGNFLCRVREEGGAGAHSVYVLDRNGINDLKPAINKYTELLKSIIQTVKDTPK